MHIVLHAFSLLTLPEARVKSKCAIDISNSAIARNLGPSQRMRFYQSVKCLDPIWLLSANRNFAAICLEAYHRYSEVTGHGHSWERRASAATGLFLYLIAGGSDPAKKSRRNRNIRTLMLTLRSCDTLRTHRQAA